MPDISDRLREITKPLEIEMCREIQNIFRNMMVAEMELPVPDEVILDMYETAINSIENIVRRME